MKKILALTCASFALALGGAPMAEAAVRYSFEAFSADDPNVVGSFVYTSDDFITSDLYVGAFALDACTVVTPVGANCAAINFAVDTTTYFLPSSGDNYDAVNFDLFTTGPIYYFSNGALGAFGVYDSLTLDTQQGRLTVSAVPEVGSVVLALSGVAMLGLTVRRRRPSTH